MKITDLKCAIIGQNPVVRITTDEGISGFGQAESRKSYLKPHVMFYRDMILDSDPTDVERVMLKIRRFGGFKPWGSSVSAIEMALWDIAGKAAGVPVYKLLGGKIRDRVRVYLTGGPFPRKGCDPADYAETVAKIVEMKEGYTITKQGIAFHSAMPRSLSGYFYSDLGEGLFYANSGLMTERGFNHTVAWVAAMKESVGDRIGLALDCGPGMTVLDAIRLARALKPYNVLWLEDMLTGTPRTCSPISTARSPRALRHRFTRESRSTCGNTSRTCSKSRR